jgi:hypothetical protein
MIKKTFDLFPSCEVYGTDFSDGDLIYELLLEADDDWSGVGLTPGNVGDVNTWLIGIEWLLCEPEFKQVLFERIINANKHLEEAISAYVVEHDMNLTEDRGLDVLTWIGAGSSERVSPDDGLSQLSCMLNIADTYAPIGIPALDIHIGLEPGDAFICPAQFPFDLTLESDDPSVRRACIRKYIR